MNKGNKEILDIALPSIVSNITVPLLGLIDVPLSDIWVLLLTLAPLPLEV